MRVPPSRSSPSKETMAGTISLGMLGKRQRAQRRFGSGSDHSVVADDDQGVIAGLRQPSARCVEGWMVCREDRGRRLTSGAASTVPHCAMTSALG